MPIPIWRAAKSSPTPKPATSFCSGSAQLRATGLRRGRTLPPIFAYTCGVAVARLLRVRPQKQTFRATLICQALELLVLLVLLFFGRFVSDFCAVPLIAFSAALQNTSFSNLGPWEFNSAMTTANLRNAVSGWVQLALEEKQIPNLGEKPSLAR